MTVLLRLAADDQVAIALRSLSKGTDLRPDYPITLRSDVPAGHKVALSAIHEGDRVRRLGQPIGLASQEIEPGDHVHEHNLAYPGTLANRNISTIERAVPINEVTTFNGYRRANGRVGTRNYIGVI